LEDEANREDGEGGRGGGGVEQLDLVHQILTRISNSNYPTLEAKETSFNQFNQKASNQETINQDLDNKTRDEDLTPDPVLGRFMEMKPDPGLGGFKERNDLEAEQRKLSEQEGLWMKMGREPQTRKSADAEPRNGTDRSTHSEPELTRKDEMEIASPVSILNSPTPDTDSQTSKPIKELHFSGIYDEGSAELSEIYV